MRIGYDNNCDADILDAGDDIQIDDDFSSNVMSLSYDNNGNLTDDGVHKFVYDAWNRLVEAKRRVDAETNVATYAYLGDNRRASKVVQNCGTEHLAGDGGNTTGHFYYGGMGGAGILPANWNVFETRNGSNQATAQYVWGTQYTDELVMVDINGDATESNDCDPDDQGGESTADERYFYHQDRNWNVAALSEYDTSGTTNGRIVERYSYTPYGQFVVLAGDSDSGELGNLSRVSSVGNVFTFQGLAHEAESGQHNVRSRTYEGLVGRFAQRDPLGYSGSGMTLYAFVGNRPTLASDPLGLACAFEGACGVGGGGSGGGGAVGATGTECIGPNCPGGGDDDCPGGNLLDPDDPNESGPYAAENAIRFSTKYFDAETALGYWGYRYYSPRLGRWLNRDPIREPGARLLRRIGAISRFSPGAWLAEGGNPYCYVRNAPQTWRDPLGLQTSQPASQPCCYCGPDITDAVIDHLNAFIAYHRGDLPFWPETGARQLERIARRNGGRFWDAVKNATGECPSAGCEGTVTLCDLCMSGYHIDHIFIMIYIAENYAEWIARMGGEKYEEDNPNPPDITAADLAFNELALCFARAMHPPGSYTTYNGVAVEKVTYGADYLNKAELCACVKNFGADQREVIANKEGKGSSVTDYEKDCAPCDDSISKPAGLELPPLDPY